MRGKPPMIASIPVLLGLVLATPFSGDDRHQRRINMLTDYETTRVIPEPPR